MKEKMWSKFAIVSEQKTKRNNQFKIISLAVFVSLVIIGIIWFGLFSLPLGPDKSIGFEIQPADHIAIGSEHPEYNSNPPTSGWHYAKEAELGFYDTKVEDEKVVHNLEQGDIWISYKSSVSDEIKQQLRKFLGKHIMITLRDENDHDITLAAWGRLDVFNIENGKLDTRRITDFIKRYKNKGPEKID